MPSTPRPRPTSSTSIRSWLCRLAALPVTYCWKSVTAVRKRMRKPRSRRIRKLGTPDRDTIKALDYVQVQRANDSGDSRSLASYLKGGFISQVPDKLVSAHGRVLRGQSGPVDASVLPALRRRRRAPAGKRHGFRAAGFHGQHDDRRPRWRLGAGDPAEHIQATRKYWATLEPFTRGFYVNDMAREATVERHQRQLSRQLQTPGDDQEASTTRRTCSG